MISRYVVGFLFTPDEDLVLLLRKQKPEWQAGKLNGVGGHVEPGEGFDKAMVREGLEESGLEPDWRHFAVLTGEDWEMHAYRANAVAGSGYPETNDVGEHFEKYRPSDVASGWLNTIPNLQWLIPMALMKERRDWPYWIVEGQG